MNPVIYSKPHLTFDPLFKSIDVNHVCHVEHCFKPVGNLFLPPAWCEICAYTDSIILINNYYYIYIFQPYHRSLGLSGMNHLISNTVCCVLIIIIMYTYILLIYVLYTGCCCIETVWEI